MRRFQMQPVDPLPSSFLALDVTLFLPLAMRFLVRIYGPAQTHSHRGSCSGLHPRHEDGHEARTPFPGGFSGSGQEAWTSDIFVLTWSC